MRLLLIGLFFCLNTIEARTPRFDYSKQRRRNPPPPRYRPRPVPPRPLPPFGPPPVVVRPQHRLFPIYNFYAWIEWQGANRIFVPFGFRPNSNQVYNSGSLFFNGTASLNNSYVSNGGIMIINNTRLESSSINNCGLLIINSQYLNGVTINNCLVQLQSTVPFQLVNPWEFNYNYVTKQQEILLRNYAVPANIPIMFVY